MKFQSSPALSSGRYTDAQRAGRLLTVSILARPFERALRETIIYIAPPHLVSILARPFERALRRHWEPLCSQWLPMSLARTSRTTA